MNEQLFIHRAGQLMRKSKERCQEIREEMRNTILREAVSQELKLVIGG